jgi:hypothetical protein
MNYYFAILFVILAGIFSACSNDTGYSSEPPDEATIKRGADVEAMMKVMSSEASVCFFVENVGEQACPIQGGVNVFFNGWEDRHHVDTVAVRTWVTDIYYGPFFKKDTECEHSDIKFYWDGELAEVSRDNPRELPLVKVPETIYTEEHVLSVKMDSAKCAGISHDIRFVPGKPYSSYMTGKDVMGRSDVDNRKCSDFLYQSLYPVFPVIGQYLTSAAYGDSIQSACYLHKGADSVRLKIEFENKGLSSLNAPSRAYAYLKAGDLNAFMKMDTVATLKCALVYQEGMVPAQVENLEYSEKEIVFTECPWLTLESVSVDDSLRITTSDLTPLWFFYGWVKNNGTYTYFKLEPNTRPSSAYSLEEICGEGCIETFDSIQVVAHFRTAQPIGSVEEDSVFPTYLEVPRDTAIIDSMIRAFTDDEGNILRAYRRLDAKRIANPLKN